MIVHLRIRDLIVVEEARLDLGPGLNVLSGSTGSGKSVLLAALSLLAGERARSDWIRAGCERAVVEALLELDERLEAALAEMGVEIEERQLSLRREIRADGRGRAFIGGSPAGVAELRRMGSLLFERQDQHEQIRLLDPSVQLALLDDYAALDRQLDEYRIKLHGHRENLEALKRKEGRLESLRSEEEYLRFQLEEIDSLDPQPGEMEDLAERERRMRNASKLAGHFSAALDLIEDGDASLRHEILRLEKILEKLASLGTEIPNGDLDGSLAVLEDLAATLRERSANMSAEALRSEELSERLNRLHTLERKHSMKLDEIIVWTAERRRDLDELETLAGEVMQLGKRCDISAEALSLAAESLSVQRRSAAKKLGKAWQAQLGGLGLSAATLRIEVTSREDGSGWIRLADKNYSAGPKGMDSVRVLVRTNPDSREGALRDIPSGGELSRIALACRLVPGLREGPPILVLDEVDAGLGADIAPVLAERLLGLSDDKQLLLVTHQAVLAAAAGRQFRVDKNLESGQTRVDVRALEGEERVDEIMRMLGGGPEDREIREHAEFLLARARSVSA